MCNQVITRSKSCCLGVYNITPTGHCIVTCFIKKRKRVSQIFAKFILNNLLGLFGLRNRGRYQVVSRIKCKVYHGICGGGIRPQELYYAQHCDQMVQAHSFFIWWRPNMLRVCLQFLITASNTEGNWKGIKLNLEI